MEKKDLRIISAILILIILGLAVYVGFLLKEINYQKEVIQLKENESEASWNMRDELLDEIRDLEMIISNRDEYIRQLEEGLIK